MSEFDPDCFLSGTPDIPDGMEFKDPLHPELGFKVRHPNRNRFIPEYSHKLGEMSLTDGVPVIRKAPEEELPYWGD